METITLKIDKRTKEGKAFLKLLDIFVEDKKGVELVNKGYSISDNIPNEETARSMEKTKKRIDLTECKDSEDMFEKLGI